MTNQYPWWVNPVTDELQTALQVIEQAAGRRPDNGLTAEETERVRQQIETAMAMMRDNAWHTGQRL